MSDYIKREDAIEAIRKSPITNLGARFSCEDAIEDIPAADVVEQKRGNWNEFEHGYSYDWGTCSCCNARVGMMFNYKYCPNCGADLRGEDDVRRTDKESAE